MILAQFDKILQNVTDFYGILGPFLCAKFSVNKFGCAKVLTFRRSGGDITIVSVRRYHHSLCEET